LPYVKALPKARNKGKKRSVGDSSGRRSRSNPQEHISGSSHIDAATEAVSEYIGSWSPDSALDLDSFLAGLPRLFDTLAAAVSGVAERLTAEFPVHPSVPEHLEEIAATVAGMSEFAAEAHAIHLVAHAAELERIENPRPNEELWDVATNR
jgi:hypothetical protein